MPIGLIVYGIVALFLLGGGALWYKSIGDKKVAEYQAQVQKEQEKIDAATATKVALESKHIDELQFVYKAGQEEGRKNAPRIAARVRADTMTAPAFQNPQCVLPEQSYALLGAAYATLHKGEISESMLAARIAPAVSQPAAQGTTPPGVPAVPAGATTQRRPPVRNPLTGATK